MKPRPIRVLSTDYDGTLVDPQAGVTLRPELAEWIIHQRFDHGLAWVINTGRGWDSLEQDLKARKFPIWPDWVVLVERYVYQVKHRRLVSLEGWNEACVRAQHEIFTEAEPFWNDLRKYLADHTQCKVLVAEDSPVEVIASTEEEALQVDEYLTRELQEWPRLDVMRNSVYFRFCPKDYHKGSALSRLTRELGCSAADTLAVGDSYNDLPMLDLRHASHLVCPVNAIDPVKEKVRGSGGFVSDRPHAPGLVQALEALGRGEWQGRVPVPA